VVGILFLALPARGTEPSDIVALTPPRAAAAHEAIWLKVTVGPLPRGSLLRVTTEDDRPVGTISPFGTMAAQAPSNYTLPLPKSASGEAVRLRIQIREASGILRPPNSSELLDVVLVYVPTSN
jgi:hypothetical protein